MRRRVSFVQGGYYHVYNRGANREAIFASDENYHFLLRRIKEQAAKCHVTMIAYCLMPNHYHIVLRQDSVDPLAASYSQFLTATAKPSTSCTIVVEHCLKGHFRRLPLRKTNI